jgi:hypothetical protein
MWWLILLIIVGIVGFFVYSRKSTRVKLSKEQLKLMQGITEKEIERNKADRKKMINQAAKDGKTI